jgi:signal transduction histidine kinase
VYFAPDDRIISVHGRSPKDARVWVRVVFNEMPLAGAILDYGLRILGLSIFISVITAGLLLVALNWMLVRPLRQLTASVLKFAADPEDADSVLVPPQRDDEVGTAMRELAAMQTVLRASLKQRERLAALGTAVTKISHDLRNMLSTASLVSESLTLIDDPKVQKVAPRLYSAINRAVALCEQTLTYSRTGTVTLTRQRFALADLLHDVCEELRALHGAEMPILCAVPETLYVDADRDQLFRVLINLGRNALEAGATEVAVRAAISGDGVLLHVADNGPGLAPRARDNLFQPFAGTARAGGTGLGLAIAREILRAHGGDLQLEQSGAQGTVFAIQLPGCARP